MLYLARDLTSSVYIMRVNGASTDLLFCVGVLLCYPVVENSRCGAFRQVRIAAQHAMVHDFKHFKYLTGLCESFFELK